MLILVANFIHCSYLRTSLTPPLRSTPLPRRSGASSSCSSYYSTSAAKAQLLSQMKDFTDNNREEDDELTYKVTAATEPPALDHLWGGEALFFKQFLRLWCRSS